METTIDREVLENIFVTALEGGSNYWYHIPSKEIAKVRKAIPKEVEPALSMAIFMAIFDKGVEIVINDAENPDEELGVLNYAIIKERLRDLSEHAHYSTFLTSEINEHGDAETSDVVFQYLTMADVVFG